MDTQQLQQDVLDAVRTNLIIPINYQSNNYNEIQILSVDNPISLVELDWMRSDPHSGYHLDRLYAERIINRINNWINGCWTKRPAIAHDVKVTCIPVLDRVAVNVRVEIKVTMAPVITVDDVNPLRQTISEIRQNIHDREQVKKYDDPFEG